MRELVCRVLGSSMNVKVIIPLMKKKLEKVGFKRLEEYFCDPSPKFCNTCKVFTKLESIEVFNIIVFYLEPMQISKKITTLADLPRTIEISNIKYQMMSVVDYIRCLIDERASHYVSYCKQNDFF